MEIANRLEPSLHDAALADNIKSMRLADLDFRIAEARKNLELLSELRARWEHASAAQILEESASFEHEREEVQRHQVLERNIEAVEHQVVQEQHDGDVVRRGRDRALAWLLVGAAPAAYVASLFPEASVGTVGVVLYAWCLLLVLGSTT